MEKLSNESQTLFIPLYGKAIMSKKNLFLKDLKAEEIVSKINYNFYKLKQSKWLSMYMSMRSLIIDKLVNKYIKTHQNTTIIHLGCGLDSRYLRVNQDYANWYDIDLKEVIKIRKQYYNPSTKYKMIGSSVTNLAWLDEISFKDNILIIAEGLFMYLKEIEIESLLNGINNKFEISTLIFDSYTKKAVKLSKYKNPVNQMKANIEYGIDRIEDFLKLNYNLKFESVYMIKHKEPKLKGLEKIIFEKLYCGKISESLYRIYEFSLKRK